MSVASTPPDKRPILDDGVLSVEVDPAAGGRISSLRAFGTELLWNDRDLPPGQADPMAWGMYPMAPFAGRIALGRLGFARTVHQLRVNLAPHGIHGTVFDRPWQIVHSSAHAIELSTDLGEHWPWAGRCTQHIALDPSAPGTLSTTIEITSDRDAFPASAGWHPWFRTDADGLGLEALSPRLAECFGRQVVRGDDGMPTGEWSPPTDGPWDDCFDGVRWPLDLCWTDRGSNGIVLSIEADTDTAVVYDERSEAWCVEPQSAPPAAVDDASGRAMGVAAAVVRPGAPLTIAARWTVGRRE